MMENSGLFFSFPVPFFFLIVLYAVSGVNFGNLALLSLRIFQLGNMTQRRNEIYLPVDSVGR